MKAFKLSFLVFAASLLGQSQLFAQATWIGADLANWNVSGNWSGTAPVNGGTSDLIFNSASRVTEVTPITTGLPDLGGNPDYEYRSFRLDASNGLLGKGFLRAKVAN